MDFKDVKKKTWIVKDLVFIIPLKLLRKTPSVEFYHIDGVIKNLAAIDKVIHQVGAFSPMIKGDKTRYWYMHPDQEDNLVVHEGKRLVELYSRKHGKIEKFECTSKKVKWNGKVIYNGPAVIGWPTKVFHRIKSPNGSISTNYAKHYSKFDIRTNFNIYSLDTKTGEYDAVRFGHQDQPNHK